MATADTVISLKESFLRTQVRLLSQRLQPSRNWRDRAPVPEQGELKEKVVQEVLHKRMHAFHTNENIHWNGIANVFTRTVNTIARNHKRAVYSSQALRHVAEQIDALYWASAAPDRESEVDGGEILEKGVDLSSAEYALLL